MENNCPVKRVRIRWSDWDYFEPIKIIITDWKNLKTVYRYYMLVDSKMEYKGREIELCVPYSTFIYALRKQHKDKQRLVINDKAVIEIMKVYRTQRGGMKIKSIEEYKEDKK